MERRVALHKQYFLPMTVSPVTQKIIFIALLLATLTPWVSAPVALVAGIVFAFLIGNPFASQSSVWVKWLLKIAIVGLGFGMNLLAAVQAGKEGILFTVGTIIFVLIAGYLLGRILKIESNTSYLVSAGTAICGGSAIAAVAPITGANNKQISIALGTVFILNAIALLVFPLIGNSLDLTQYQFGLWSAIAIHDTSSVVGAASAYGDEALMIATTIKLSRALWIIPLTLFTVAIAKKSSGKVAIPYFILLFIAAMAVATFFPAFQDGYVAINWAAKRLLVATLFLIGAGLSPKTLRSVGLRVFLQGTLLWILVSTISLAAILFFN